MKHTKRLSILLFLFLSYFLFNRCSDSSKETIEKSVAIQDIEDNWSFSDADSTHTGSAIVPGCIHIDLTNNKYIEDPRFSNSYQSIEWISRKEWVYTTRFDVTETVWNKRIKEISFEGLDTYAEVCLNDSIILSANNMFRKYSVNVQNLLKQKENLLTVRFSPSEKSDSLAASKYPYQFPDIRVFSRKAPFQSGWDFAEKLPSCGIWKSIQLTGWNNEKIENIRFLPESVDSTEAKMRIILDLFAEAEQSIFLEVKEVSTNKVFLSKEISVLAGPNTLSEMFNIENPRLWWCNGLGKPELYNFIVSIKEDHEIIDHLESTTGIRKIELVQDPDSIGRSFYFRLNGKPVFAKGANYVPLDIFPSEISNEKHSRLIDMAVDANMNMLRVWGGGIYESDHFYRICDEKGIMIWQDFMFACAMYPCDGPFLNSVGDEVSYQIKRLSNHPSIVLWCGNNEVLNGWQDWGWQKQFGYTNKDSSNLASCYNAIFQSLIPDSLAHLDGTRPYWPSSPEYGWGHPECNTHGDSHYWGVWWGMKPFEQYEKNTGRFMSEYGFQGMPSFSTVQNMTGLEFPQIDSKELAHRQKHPRGFETINQYMEWCHDLTDDPEKYCYLSQIVQAEGMQTAIESHRRNAPTCMGSIYWQLNDCWPSISWSAIDYYLLPKALFYYSKRLFSTNILSVSRNDDAIKVFAISDDTNSKPCRIDACMITLSGDTLYFESKLDTLCYLNPSINIFKNPEISKNIKDSTSIVFNAVLKIEDSVIYSKAFYFTSDKNLNLQPASITAQTKESSGGTLIKLSSDKVARHVFIDYPDKSVTFSDNFFDLIPGIKKEVFICGKIDPDRISIRAYNELIWEK